MKLAAVEAVMAAEVTEAVVAAVVELAEVVMPHGVQEYPLAIRNTHGEQVHPHQLQLLRTHKNRKSSRINMLPML